ncbi:MAG: hypothetical protein MMC33_005562 [Icmadophila ericetorum]|nr:hypothetical protein [Icmadophila ericetorum]
MGSSVVEHLEARIADLESDNEILRTEITVIRERARSYKEVFDQKTMRLEDLEQLREKENKQHQSEMEKKAELEAKTAEVVGTKKRLENLEKLREAELWILEIGKEARLRYMEYHRRRLGKASDETEEKISAGNRAVHREIPEVCGYRASLKSNGKLKKLKDYDALFRQFIELAGINSTRYPLPAELKNNIENHTTMKKLLHQLSSEFDEAVARPDWQEGFNIRYSNLPSTNSTANSPPREPSVFTSAKQSTTSQNNSTPSSAPQPPGNTSTSFQSK